jgi:hypothetical protein
MRERAPIEQGSVIGGKADSAVQERDRFRNEIVVMQVKRSKSRKAALATPLDHIQDHGWSKEQECGDCARQRCGAKISLFEKFMAIEPSRQLVLAGARIVPAHEPAIVPFNVGMIQIAFRDTDQKPIPPVIP